MALSLYFLSGLPILMAFVAIASGNSVSAYPVAAFSMGLLLILHKPSRTRGGLFIAALLAWGIAELYASSCATSGLQFCFRIHVGFELVGGGLFALALLGLQPRRPLRLSFLAILPLIALAIYLSFAERVSPHLIISAWLQLALLLLALPALEATIHGSGPEARILWGLGLFIQVQTGFMQALLGTGDPHTVQVAFLLSSLGYLLIGTGLWLEFHSKPMNLSLLALGIGGIESSWCLVLLAVHHTLLSYFPLILALTGYLLLISVLALVAADRKRRLKAEARLANWVQLLERLNYAVPLATYTVSPLAVLEDILSALHTFTPHIVGLEVLAKQRVTIGETTLITLPISGLSHVGRVFLKSQPHSEDLRRNLQALSPLLESRLRQVLVHVQWQDQAMTDPLTGLLNRRGMHGRLGQLIALCQRYQQPLSVVMLDLDFFKKVNDHYGHSAGDQVLRQVSNILLANLRGEDLAIRFGGEEFAMFLYGADLKKSAGVLERIRVEVASPLPHPPVTISAGLSGGRIPVDTKQVDVWFQQADQALLEAKARGRNRIETLT